MSVNSGHMAQPSQPPCGRTGVVPGTTSGPHRSSELCSGTGPAFHNAKCVPGSTPAPVSYPLVSTMPPLGALKTAPGAVRAHLKSTLIGWDMAAYEEVAELLSSELVTNAVVASTDEHGKPRYIEGNLPVIVFRMLGYRDALILEVWDMIRKEPVVQQADDLDEHGRGMLLVETLATRWNWKTAPDWPGKCVWVEIRG